MSYCSWANANLNKYVYTKKNKKKNNLVVMWKIDCNIQYILSYLLQFNTIGINERGHLIKKMFFFLYLNVPKQR